MEKEAVLSHLTIKKGDRAESINFGWMEVVSEPYPSGNPQKPWKVDVRFDDTGHVRTNVMANAFCQGNVRDGSVVCKPRIGGRYRTNFHGWFTIININGSKDISVKFDNTGNVQECQLDNILTGLITDREEVQRRLDEDRQRAIEYHKRVEESKRQEADRKKKWEATKRAAYKRKIEELNKRIQRLNRERQQKEDTLKWLENLVDVSVADSGKVKECASRVSYDFKKDDKWVLAWTEKDGTFMKSRLGAMYNNMQSRGKIGGACQEINRNYKGVTIHPNFQDFQRFCEWAVNEPGYANGYQLEKDLLIPGNREYGPDACCFLPSCLNMAIIQPKFGARSWCQEGRSGYTLTMQINNTTLRLKGFDSEDAVHASYKAIRERYVKALAEKFKDTISERAYEALMKWEVVIPETEQESTEV